MGTFSKVWCRSAKLRLTLNKFAKRGLKEGDHYRNVGWNNGPICNEGLIGTGLNLPEAAIGIQLTFFMGAQRLQNQIEKVICLVYVVQPGDLLASSVFSTPLSTFQHQHKSLFLHQCKENCPFVAFSPHCLTNPKVKHTSFSPLCGWLTILFSMSKTLSSCSQE